MEAHRAALPTRSWEGGVCLSNCRDPEVANAHPTVPAVSSAPSIARTVPMMVDPSSDLRSGVRGSVKNYIATLF